MWGLSFPLVRRVSGGSPKFDRFYESPEQTITAAGLLTLAHGLGTKRLLIQWHLVCKIAEANYAVGNEVPINISMVGFNNGQDMSATVDATNISVRYGNAAGSGGTVFQLPNKTTGARVSLTNANWRLVVRAWAGR